MDRATIQRLIDQLLQVEDKVRTHIEDFYTTQYSTVIDPEAGLLVAADEIVSDMMSTLNEQLGDE